MLRKTLGRINTATSDFCVIDVCTGVCHLNSRHSRKKQEIQGYDLLHSKKYTSKLDALQMQLIWSFLSVEYKGA